jgi:DNA-directed RNA polymerase subunit RPC12/RpoP
MLKEVKIMSSKFMKVYICDYCGKIEAPRLAFCGLGDVFKTAPKDWMHVCNMDLCSTCGRNFVKLMGGNDNESVSE